MPMLFNMQHSYNDDEVSEGTQRVSWITAKEYIILANINTLVADEYKQIVIYIAMCDKCELW